MQNREWERALQLKTEYLTVEYMRIVGEFFPGVTQLDNFVELFSHIFTHYQSSNKLKLDPDSIRNRNISCSSAAALLGIWWVQQFPQLHPVFLVQDVSREASASLSSAHVNVAIPLYQPITDREALAAFHSPQKRNGVEIIDWTEHSQMKRSNPSRTYDVYAVDGIQRYLRDRLKHLGLTKKYSSEKIEQLLRGRDLHKIEPASV
jgi:hypothetical protein